MTEHESNGAQFIARMAAGTTHEFRNILAIVSESAGLIQDLTESDKPSPGGVLRAVQRIEKQVGRGAELVGALNSLAHALDHESEDLDLAEQARLAIVLCRHWTGQGQRRMTVGGEPGVRIQANRFRLCQLLTAAVECAASWAPPGSEVLVAAGWQQERPALRLRRCAPPGADPRPPSASPEWGWLNLAAAAIGGAVEAAGDASEFVVLFPRSSGRA